VLKMTDRFPLGTPVNRKPLPDFQPIVGRPGWWRHPITGVEQYREPPKKTAPDEQDLIWPGLISEEE
jgi:hypothetical protein